MFQARGTKRNACRDVVAYACRLGYAHMDGLGLEGCATGTQNAQAQHLLRVTILSKEVFPRSRGKVRKRLWCKGLLCFFPILTDNSSPSGTPPVGLRLRWGRGGVDTSFSVMLRRIFANQKIFCVSLRRS